MALPSLLERLRDQDAAERSGLLAIADELRALACRYGATVVCLRTPAEAPAKA